MKRPKRILHVIATLDRAGTEMVCLQTARGMAEMGIENRIVALEKGEGTIEADFQQISAAPVVLPGGRSAKLKAFWRLLTDWRPDGVLFHFFTIDHALMSVVARSLGVSAIVIVQGNPVIASGLNLLKLKAILWVTRLLQLRLVSVSHYIEETMAALGKLPKCSRVIHNGCDVRSFATRSAISRTMRQSTEIVILMVARLDRIKDHKTLIAALSRMPEEIDQKKIVLKLIGDGNVRSKLEAQAEHEGIADRVQFLGRRADIPEQMGRAHVFCLSTTVDEGFGVVLIEAMASGVPIVASDVPACREVLEDGSLGRLVPPGNADLLSKALVSTIRNPHTLPSGDVVETKYGITAMASGYLGLLAIE